MSMALDLHAALSSNYLMRDLDPRQISEVAALASTKEFGGGETLVRQFAKDADLMIVLEGRAKIKSFSGEEIAEAGPGSVIGEMSLIDDKPRSATVTAAGPVTVALISNSALWGLMDREPQVGKTILLNVGRILAARLRAANVALDSVVER
ncbi:MAG: cyclic nucleotide-binding domain-containing protein [Armatimonadetes bacterium]|nr:cyclic nucleotide-binding domain-containing protein [Armatimonadota bacterium]